MAPAQEQEQRLQEAGAGEAGLTASQHVTPTEEMTEPTTMAPAPLPHPAASILARSPPGGSPWMMPHSPTRSVRSVSPVVGSYFGTGSRIDQSRRDTPLHEDEDLDFWGGQSPRSQGEPEHGEHDDDSSSDGLDAMEEDEPEEEEEGDDVMDILGHR